MTESKLSPLRVRAEEAFATASSHLQTVIKEISEPLAQIKFPSFDLLDNLDDRAKVLENTLEGLLQSRKELAINQHGKKKAKEVLIGWFRASYPFANLFLQLTKEAFIAVERTCFITDKP